MDLRVPSPATARRTWRLWPLALLLGTSLYATGFWLFGGLGPQPWAEAAAAVRQDLEPGDAVTTRPWWAARIREYLGDAPFVQVRDLAAEDLSAYGRLWLVSLPGHQDSPGGPFADGTYRLIERRRFGDLLLRLYRLPPPARVAFDFRAELPRARVSIAAASGPRACDRWVENRWVCSRADWNYVGRMIVELGDDPREVIWAHPTDEGPLEIRYPNVPGGRTLLVHTGLTPPAARAADGAPVKLEVLVDGRRLAELIQPNRSGWFAHPLAIDSLGPGPHRVAFRISARRVGMRHFCFQAEVRK